jgi:hypothetical protein
MAEKTTTHDDDAILEEWCAALLGELGLDDVSVDINAVLGLAGVVAHAVARPAAPLTAFVVGYSAARVAERTGVSAAEAFASASSAAKELARSGAFGSAEQ